MENVQQDTSAAAVAVNKEVKTPLNARRMRRQSMEQLSLIQLTPDKKKEKQTEKEREEKEKLDKIGKSKKEKKLKKPMTRAESEDLTRKSFFEMICRCQSDRMDEQRAVLNPKEGPVRSKSFKLFRSASSAEERVSARSTELHPVIKKALKRTKAALPPDLQTQRNICTKDEDDFLDMIALMQGSRMDDQRAELPGPKLEEQPRTLPDDVFFNQLMSAQADRMEDQRATLPAKSKSSAKGDTSSMM